MKSKWCKLICAMAIIGLLIATNAFAASIGVYSGLKQLEPQLSADGNTLYNGISAVVLVADPHPPESQVNIPPPEKLITEPEKASATFSITYIANGGADIWGQPCLTFPEEAKAAFNASAAVWGNLLQSSVPITIKACWADLGSSSILGYSGGGSLYRNFAGAPKTDTWYGSALSNALYGSNLSPGAFDMNITYNKNFAWYYETDGATPAGQYDLMSVVLHEIAHGLNFSGSMQYASGTGSYGYGTGYPNVYDTFMRDGTANPGNLLTNTSVYPNPSTALGSAVTSASIWFHGANAMAANGGQRVKIYAPSTWLSGSSYSHLDYTTFAGGPNRLMVYAISSGISTHSPGPVTLGIIKDLGWPNPTPSDESTLYASFAGSGIWKNQGTNWTQVSSDNPALMVTSGSILYGSFAGGGVWKYDGTTWTQATPNNPAQMVTSGTNLYGTFAGAGIWKFDGISWTQATPNNPQQMVISGTDLYGSFTGGGIWKWNGTTWTQATPNTPLQMVATPTTLYVNFAGAGIWKWNGTSWTQATPNSPQTMVGGGETLYGSFAGGGVWKLNGSSWTQVTPNTLIQMVASENAFYGVFPGSGIWKFDGTSWTQVTPNTPVIMVLGSSETPVSLGDLNNWNQLAGDWTSDGTNFSTNGLDGFFASISYKDQTFSDVDFTALLYREGSSTGDANYLYLRGTPDPLRASKGWYKGYQLGYTSNGYYSVWLCNGDGTSTAMQGWTATSAIITGANWNLIRAVASGTTISLYINGTLVWTGTDSTWASGQIGIAQANYAGSTGNIFRVQQASLSTGISSSQAGVISSEQAALNNAPSGGGNADTSK